MLKGNSFDIKEATLKNNRIFPLSLQKGLEKRNLCMDSEIHKALGELKIKSLLGFCGIVKHKGFPSIMREIDKRTNGWCRRKEALDKKTDVLIQMLHRTWQHGIDPSFDLFGSWFAHDAVIAQIMDVGYGVICRLKAGRVKYTYQSRPYTPNYGSRQPKTMAFSEFQLKAVCLNVALPKSGSVRLLFLSDGKKQ
jgi:hypothetical protein|tara:strand:- start:1502 stop:2083 length:582 start_codon:yes stop_codon:yes gene_type:complete